jgi:hypothetical protein
MKPRTAIARQISAWLVSTIQKDDLAKSETNWRDCAANSEKIAESDYWQQHADLLRDLVCNANTARKEIADGVIENWIWLVPNRRKYNSRLARGLLGRDGKDCATTQDLSDNTKARLHELESTPAGDN